MTLSDLFADLKGLNREWGELDAMPVEIELTGVDSVRIVASGIRVHATLRSVRLDPARRVLILSERDNA